LGSDPQPGKLPKGGNMASIRTAARAAEGEPRPEWLTLIHESNRIDSKMFTTPVLGSWWAGGTCEEYENARVLHRGDGTVSVVSKTDHGHKVLVQAAENINLPWRPTWLKEDA